jgi:indole-3-glycerol phosphate synthase
MTDELESLVRNAERLVASGYYDEDGHRSPGSRLSAALRQHDAFPIIAEVKLASPSAGKLTAHAPERLIGDYLRSGAAALSVLTEPDRFNGSLPGLGAAVGRGLPVLMKDIVVSERQIEAAASHGASAVLLIQEVFDGPRAPRREGLIERAHALGLEVLLEAASGETLRRAMNSRADLLGINQRDLRTLLMDRERAAQLLPMAVGDGRPVVVLSGIDRREAVTRARDGGASAVLVGGHLSSAADPAQALRALAVPR